MATALEQNVNLVNALTQLGTYAFGSPAKTTNTTGGTTTTQKMFDPTATSALIQQLLGASGLNGTGKTGLAATMGMSKSAGLYNSSTQDLLNNDLLSRITGEISIAGAPTVQTNANTSSTTKQTGVLGSTISSLMMPLALLSMTSGGKKILKGAMQPVNDLSDTLANAMGFGSPATGGGIDAGISTGVEGVSSADMAGGLLPASVLNDMGVGGAGGAAAVNPITGAADTAMRAAAGTGLGMSAAEADTALAGFDTAVGGTAGLDTAFAGASAAATGAAVDAGASAGIGDLFAEAALACFITTAIMRSLGHNDDDCEELTILRNYRDSWLINNHPDAVSEYYRIAPAIVDKINAMPDAEDIWHKLYLMHLVPALAEIAAGRNEEAYQIYKQMVTVAKEIA